MIYLMVLVNLLLGWRGLGVAEDEGLNTENSDGDFIGTGANSRNLYYVLVWALKVM